MKFSRVFSVEEYREMNFGDFERKNYIELKENADYQRWIVLAIIVLFMLQVLGRIILEKA